MSTTLSSTFARQQHSLVFLHQARSLLVLFSSIVLAFGSACTTTRSIDPRSASAAEMQEELEPGDPVTVLLRDGRELDLSFEGWTAEHFAGRGQTNLLHAIQWQDISRLQVSSFSGVRTALLALGVYGAGAAVVIAALNGEF